MPPTDPTDLGARLASELDAITKAVALFAADVRIELWNRDAEVAALRTENDSLNRQLDTPPWTTLDQARAELAAERARHETTRAKVRAVEALRDEWMDAPRGTVQHVAGTRLDLAVSLTAALAAASPSPVAGQDQPKEPTP